VNLKTRATMPARYGKRFARINVGYVMVKIHRNRFYSYKFENDVRRSSNSNSAKHWQVCDVRRWLQLRFDFGSTATGPRYDHSTTFRYDLALRP